MMEKENSTDNVAVADEIRELKRIARKTQDRKLRQRCDLVRLHLQGKKKKEIAEILAVSLTQVYLILKLYQDTGMEGLAPKHPPGRKPKLTQEQETELRDVIANKLPKEVGLHPYCNWTAPLVCKYVENHYGVVFSERGMRDVFYRLNLCYTRPTYVLAKADPQKQAEFLDRLEDIKKNS